MIKHLTFIGLLSLGIVSFPFWVIVWTIMMVVASYESAYDSDEE